MAARCAHHVVTLWLVGFGTHTGRNTILDRCCASTAAARKDFPCGSFGHYSLVDQDVQKSAKGVPDIKAPDTPGFSRWSVFDKNSSTMNTAKGFLQVINLN